MISEQLSLFENKYDKIDNLVDKYFWAYHAGMADGDGCITIKEKKYPYYALSLCDKNIVEEIANLYGVAITKVKKEKKHHKQMYKCALYSANSKHFISRIAPYLIEKKRYTASLCKKFNLEIKEPDCSIDLNLRFAWLAGYFDAEGSVRMTHNFIKKNNNYKFIFRVNFTSTNLLVLRFVRKLLNRVFNRGKNKSILNLYLKPDKRLHTKPSYELCLRQATKILIFGKVFLPIIKVQRKIDKFKRIINYALFAANQKWRFGHIDFKKNTEIRERWLKASEME